MKLEIIIGKIYEVRSCKVMLDFDLAELYEVETKALNQAVKRNATRFPSRFMFRLTIDEWTRLRSQIVTAQKQIKRNVSATPFAFTEYGVTMLSGVLRSEKAIQMNIAIVEAFIALKEFALHHNELTKKIKEIEARYDTQFKDVYEAINYLLNKDKHQQEQSERKRIGFK